MLTIWGTNGRRLCDRLSRREFLGVGALGLGGLTLADLLRLQARGAARPRGAGKAVIMVYLQGGPSHIDTYDPKPGAPAEYRGEFRPIPTHLPGVQLSEHLPLQAQIADRLAIIRNLRFFDTNHVNTYTELFSGVPASAPRRPVFGSVVSRLQGSIAAGLPRYVALKGKGPGAKRHDTEDPAYLGAAHRPFTPDARGLGNLSLAPGMTRDRLADRKALLRAFDGLRRDIDDAQATLAGRDAFTERALEMIGSDRVRDAFDLDREPDRVKERYAIGANPKTDTSGFLLARRLVEAGVSVVTLSFPGPLASAWDTHKDNFNGTRQQLALYDPAVHALITDLHERGLDRDVAVVLWGEFGRTPRVNKDAGRDHWAEAGCAVIAGGGLQMGQVVGATDPRGGRPIGQAYTPQNVLATLFHILDIDPATTLPDHSGRPMYLVDDPRKITELL